MAEEKTTTGKVDTIEAKEKRLSMKIGGRYFTLWGEQEPLDEVQATIKAGNYVKITYTEKANPNSPSNPYKNIQTIQKIAAPPQSQQTSGGSDFDEQRNKEIKKSVALQCAVEFSKTQAFAESLTEKEMPVTKITAVADAFYAWLTLPFPVQNTKELVEKKETGNSVLISSEENIE